MANLSVEICGVTLKNPVIAASGTFGYGREFEEFYPISMLGGVSCKGTTLKPRQGNPAPRIAETPAGMLNSVGLQNPGADAVCAEQLPWLSRQTAVLMNIAGSSVEEYAEMAARMDQTEADFLEVNISCPNVKEGGVGFGTTEAGVAAVTAAVRKATTKPIIMKLTPNVTDIAAMAAVAESEGADAVSLINTLTGMRIDLRTRRPVLRNNTGGLSGPALLPIAIRMVRQVYKKVRIPIIGMGGISTWEDAAEMMIAGAAAVQVGAANFRDPMAMPRIIEGLERFAAAQGLQSITQLTGTLQEW
jgi:dihydroorotate dehydrogenase (NAD+) catalytic subunit